MIKRKINPDHLIWKTEYNIGSFKVDLEHQSLFNLAKKALHIRELKTDEEALKELKSIIESLYTYVKEHFKNEEAYMMEVKFPEFKEHKEIHNQMLIQLYKFTQTLNSLTIDAIEEQLYHFIENYFIHHIVDEDIQIGLWVNSLDKIRTHLGWKREYETGNYKIDNEHKKMFEILEDAFKPVDDQHREQKIKTLLHNLYDFMKYHFKNEETFMRRTNYPDYKIHLEAHNNIVNETNQLLSKIKKTDPKLFEKQLALFIDEHIIGHMLDEDKKLTEFEEKSK